MTEVKQNRISWIDDARMFAMCCVVLCHIKSAMNTPETMGFSFWIVSFNMPLFVLLSAYMGYNAITRIESSCDYWLYIKRMSLRIALPTIVASTLYSMLESMMTISIKSIATNTILLFSICFLYVMLHNAKYKETALLFSLGLIPLVLYRCGGYWFLNMLLIMMLMVSSLDILLKFSQHKMVLRGKMFIICIVMLLVSFFVRRYYLIKMCPYFIVGLLLKKYDLINKLQVYKFIWIPFLIIGFVLFFYLYDNCYFYNHSLYGLIKEGKMYIWPLRIICGVSWCMTFLFLIKLYSNKYSFFSKCGTITIGIYLYHIPVFNYLMSQNISLDLPILIYWIVGFGMGVIILLLTTLLCLMMKQNRIMRNLLLGEIKI